MRTMFAALALAPAILLIGCPADTATLQRAAQASENAAIVVQGLETAEIAAHNQGLIPDADHQFIQKEVLTISALGKTTDSCIGGAGTTAGAVVCINTAVTQITQIEADGGLYLKSASAQQQFSIATNAVKTVLLAVETTLTGQPTATSTSAI